MRKFYLLIVFLPFNELNGAKKSYRSKVDIEGILATSKTEKKREEKREIINQYLERSRNNKTVPNTLLARKNFFNGLETKLREIKCAPNIFDAGYAFADLHGKALGHYLLTLINYEYENPKIAQLTINEIIQPLHIQSQRNDQEEIANLYPEHHGFFTLDKERFEL